MCLIDLPIINMTVAAAVFLTVEGQPFLTVEGRPFLTVEPSDVAVRQPFLTVGSQVTVCRRWWPSSWLKVAIWNSQRYSNAETLCLTYLCVLTRHSF